MTVTQVFTEEELITILEITRVALADGETFDQMAEELDISDDEMTKLREKIQAFIEGVQ